MSQENRGFWQKKGTVRYRPNGLFGPKQDTKYWVAEADNEGDLKRRSRRKTYAIFVFVMVICIVIWNILKNFEENGPPHIRSTEFQFKAAAVASDATICSAVGRDILEIKNGSAVDAAVATLLCMGVANLHSMGLGGGMLATIFDRKLKRVFTLDARETAPGQATKDMFVGNPEKSVTGGLSIAVPGEIQGYWAMHQRFGRLPWVDLFQPAIKLCEDGFTIAGGLKRAIKFLMEKRSNPQLRELFTNSTSGKVYNKGDVLKLPKLAQTLRTIAQEGADTFYTGSLSRLVMRDMKEAGSIITANDLEVYRARWRDPLEIRLKDGLTVYSSASPGGGAMLALALNIIDGYNLSPESVSTLNNTILTYHRLVETMKFAYSFRPELADPDFVDIAKAENDIVSKKLADKLRPLISDQRTYDTEYYGNTPYHEVKPGTAHLSLLDAEGNAVSVTSTINQYVGSGVIGKRTGIIFNCAMDDFSTPNFTNHFGIEPFPANFIRPGKRPLSSMNPVVILEGDNSVKMVTGAAGGSRIMAATIQVILGVLRFGQNLTEATDTPRFHHQLLPTHLDVDKRLSKEIGDGFKAKGHKLGFMGTRSSVVQSILVQNKQLFAISDNRKGGLADGF